MKKNESIRENKKIKNNTDSKIDQDFNGLKKFFYLLFFSRLVPALKKYRKINPAIFHQ